LVDAISPYAVEAGKFNNTGSNPVLTTKETVTNS